MSAQTIYTWQGGTSSDATNALNWNVNGVPPFNTNMNARLSVSNGANNTLIYSAAQGTSIFASTTDRGLFIGSGVAGAMEITGGVFDSRGVSPDGMSNGFAGSLTISGGSYIHTNGTNFTFLVKFGNAGTGTLTVNSGSFTNGPLQYGDTAASTGTGIVNLNGGLMSVHRVIEAGGTANVVNSTFNFNGGILQARIPTIDFMQNLNTANVLAGGAIIDSQANDITINQNLTGSVGDGGLTKQGAGTLVLNGANTYTGATTLSAGTLTVGNATALGTNAAGTTIVNNARLQLSGNITVAGEALTLNGNGNVGTTDVSGALRSTSGDNTWSGNILLGSDNSRVGAIGAPQTLRLSGVIDDGANSYTIAVRNADAGGKVVFSGANTYGGNTDVIVGLLQIDAGDNRLPIGTTLRLSNGSNVATATFDLNGWNQQVAGLTNQSTTQSATVTNSSGTASTLTINNAAANTFSGTISGNLSLTKTGAGTLTLSGSAANGNPNNTYTGLTTVSNGTLSLGKTGGIAVPGNLAISNGAKVAFSQSAQIGATSNVTLGGAGSVFNGTGTNTGVFTTTQTLASLTATGGSFNAGTNANWTVTGATSFTGGADNTIFVGNNGHRFQTGSLAIKDMLATAGGTVATNNSFTVYGSNATTVTTLAVGSGGISLDNARINLRRGAGGQQGSRIVLDGNITVTGSGTTSYITEDVDGGTTGSLAVELSSTAGPVTRTVDVSAGNSFATNVRFTDGASSGAGVTKTGAGIMRFSGPLANTYTGLTTVNQGELQLSKQNNVVSIAGDLLIENGAKLTIATFNSANNQFAPTSHVTMSGSNSVFNGTGVNTGQANTIQTLDGITATGGTFNTGSLSGASWTFTGNSSFTGGAGNTRFIGNSGAANGIISFNGLSLVNMNGTGAITAANAFDVGAGNFTTVAVGSGGLSLNNSNIRLSQGAGGSRLLLDGNVTTTGSSATGIILLPGTTGATAPRIDLSSTSGSHNRTFTTGADAPLLVNVAITNGAATAGSITKSGPGVMTLTAANTYSGGTTVEAGTLLVNNTSGSGLGSGPVIVQSAATLGGDGTITTSGLTVQSGGTLSPGNSPDVMTIFGNTTLAAGSNFEVDVAIGGVAGTGNGTTGTDLLTVNGTLDLTGALLTGVWGGNLTNQFKGNLNPDNMFWIVDNDLADSIVGTFANTTASPGLSGLFGTPAHFASVGGQPFALFYQSQFGNISPAGLSGGNDLLLVAIPEPSRALLALLTLLPLFLRRQRNRA